MLEVQRLPPPAALVPHDLCPNLGGVREASLHHHTALFRVDRGLDKVGDGRVGLVRRLANVLACAATK